MACIVVAHIVMALCNDESARPTRGKSPGGQHHGEWPTLHKQWRHPSPSRSNHACVHTRLHACVHTWLHACLYTRLHACVHARLPTRVRTVLAHAYTCHTSINAHAYVCMSITCLNTGMSRRLYAHRTRSPGNFDHYHHHYY